MSRRECLAYLLVIAVQALVLSSSGCVPVVERGVVECPAVGESE